MCLLLSLLKAANDNIPIGKVVWESSIDVLAGYFSKMHLEGLIAYPPACLPREQGLRHCSYILTP